MRILRRMIPSSVKIWICRLPLRHSLVVNFAYDRARFRKWAVPLRKKPDRANLAALIAMDYHRLEKGLSLRVPRPGFGGQAVLTLLRNLDKYLELFGPDILIARAFTALQAYVDYNREHQVCLPLIENRVSELGRQADACPELVGDQAQATRKVTRSEVAKTIGIDLKAFLASRSSVRDFSDDPVSGKLIEEAVSLATYTPSVCNRQSWRVYQSDEAREKDAVLQLQNGNRGFRDQIDKVLIVTSDTSTFVTIGERNQCWIDGGMFAMSLVYALHNLGLGTCCLNWSVEKASDRALRKVLDIPDNEAIIMIIAVGNLKKEYHVAQSSRKNVGEILMSPYRDQLPRMKQ